MAQNFMNTRSWVLTAILLIGITACIVPAAAENAWLEINSVPSSAWACLDHWNCHDTPITFALDTNSFHTVTVYKDGYLLSTQTVYATGSGETTRITVALVPIPPQTGSIDLDSRPAGAGIWIDMRYYGNTPQIIGGLSAGTHSLALRKAGYYEYTEPFTIVTGLTTTLSPAMTPYTKSSGYGSLQIDSTPGGAAIFLNNNYQGSTLVKGEAFDLNQLTPGTYTLKLTLPDYQPYTQTIIVSEGMVYDTHVIMVPVTPGPTPDTTGEILVRSSPSGANIYLDNAYRGITPLTLVDIPQGSHAIVLKMNGYQNWQSSVNVQGGIVTDLSGTLSPSPQPTTFAPQPTKSPIALVSIISAVGICGAAAILYRKSE
jgi:hypothetical protein